MVEDYLKCAIKKVNDFLGGLIAILTVLNWMGNPELHCDEKSIQYKYAHSLSQERLEKIYFDLKKYVDKGIDTRRNDRYHIQNPQEFSDLKYTRILLPKNSDYAIVRLSFCIDQSIDIEVKGLVNSKPIIYLSWGEIDRTSEVLWSNRRI